MINLPDEVIVNVILTRLTISNLFQVLQVNSHLNKLCSSTHLWEQIRIRDYPKSTRSPTLTSLQTYRLLSHKRFKPELDPEELYRLNQRNIRFNNPEIEPGFDYNNTILIPGWDWVDNYVLESSRIDSSTGIPHKEVLTRLNSALRSPLPNRDEF